MNQTISQRTSLTLLLIASLLLNLAACNSSDNNADPQASGAPALPAKETFLLDTSNFTAAMTSAAATGGYATGVTIASSSNYNFAAFNVGVWNLFIGVGLAIPVAAFLESFHHSPVLQPDGSWVWSYAVTVNNVLYTAQLYGKVDAGDVYWDMYISKEGAYSRFHWYSGVADLEGSAGYWILNKSPDEPVDLLRIDWHRDTASGTGDIKYTNIEPGATENGGYIFYGTTSESPYDAYYDIYNKGQDDLIEIQWHRSNRDGRVRNLKHFGNQDWHYWDSSLQDSAAP